MAINILLDAKAIGWRRRKQVRGTCQPASLPMPLSWLTAPLIRSWANHTLETAAAAKCGCVKCVLQAFLHVP